MGSTLGAFFCFGQEEPGHGNLFSVRFPPFLQRWGPATGRVPDGPSKYCDCAPGFEEFGPCRRIDAAFDQVVDRFAVRMCVRRDPECRAHPLCQGSCPLLYFSSISQVGGIGR